MSAFVVPRLHIDLLVKVAITGPLDADANPCMAFPLRSVDREERKLTAEIQPSELGALWLVENVRSVTYCYPETVSVGSVPWIDEEWAQAYRYTDPSYRMTCAETARAITCMEYQSCEHPEWTDSDAKHALDRLRDEVLDHLPGIASAPLVWTARELSARGEER